MVLVQKVKGWFPMRIEYIKTLERNGQTYENIPYEVWEKGDPAKFEDRAIEMCTALSRTRAGNHCAMGDELTGTAALKALNKQAIQLALGGKADESQALSLRIDATAGKDSILELHADVFGTDAE